MIRVRSTHQIAMAVVMFCILLVLASVIATKGFADGNDKATSADEDQIREVLNEQTQAWNRGDVRAFMNGYFDSDKTTFIGAGGIIRGWGHVLDRYKKTFPTPASMGQLSFTNLEVHLTCADAAYVIGEYRLVRMNNNLSGVFTLEFHRFVDGWRITVDHSTPYSVQHSANK